MHWIIKWEFILKSSVQFSRSVVSDSLRPHESQHARPPCPSQTPRVDSNSCLLSRWCHPAISSSVVPFSSCPQPLPASGSFPVSQLFASGGESIGVSLSNFTDHLTQAKQVVKSSRALSCFTWHSDPGWTHEGSKPRLWKQPWYRREQLCSSAISTYTEIIYTSGFPGGWAINNPPASAADGLDPWLRKIPGEGNGNRLQYSYVGNPMDRGAWGGVGATVHGVTKSPTWLNY